MSRRVEERTGEWESVQADGSAKMSNANHKYTRRGAYLDSP